MEVNKSMIIREGLMMDPGTARIMMEFGMHCLGCPHATAESIEMAAAAHGVDADALVEKLNEFFAAQK